jgi:hypothetical protein
VIDLLADAGLRAAPDIVVAANRQLMIGRTRWHLPRMIIQNDNWRTDDVRDLPTGVCSLSRAPCPAQPRRYERDGRAA